MEEALYPDHSSFFEICLDSRAHREDERAQQQRQMRYDILLSSSVSSNSVHGFMKQMMFRWTNALHAQL